MRCGGVGELGTGGREGRGGNGREREGEGRVRSGCAGGGRTRGGECNGKKRKVKRWLEMAERWRDMDEGRRGGEKERGREEEKKRGKEESRWTVNYIYLERTLSLIREKRIRSETERFTYTE